MITGDVFDRYQEQVAVCEEQAEEHHLHDVRTLGWPHDVQRMLKLLKK